MFNKLIIILTITTLSTVCLEMYSNVSPYFNTMYDSARHSYFNQDFERALSISYKIINSKEEKNEVPAEILAKTYNIIGVIHKTQGNIHSAIEFYEKAIDYSTDSIIISNILMNIANIFIYIGDYQKSIIYYNRALLLANDKDKNLNFNIFSNLATAYYIAGFWDKSIETIDKCQQIAEDCNISNLSNEYTVYAMAQQKLNNYIQAKRYFVKALKINIDEYGYHDYRTAYCLYNFGDQLVKEKIFNEGLNIVIRAYTILNDALGFKNPYTSDCLNIIGQIHYQQGNYEIALSFYQKSLVARIANFNDSSVYANPEVSQNADLGLLDILKNKAKALEKLYQLEGSEKHLGASLTTLMTASGFAEKIRIGYLSENSKLRLTSNDHDIYLAGLRIASQLYSLTNDRKYLSLAFNFSEREKYGILRELRREAEARGYAGIPDSLSQKERSLSQELAGCKAIIDEENRIEKPDLSYLGRLNEKLFELTRKQEQLIGYLEKNYPDYYQMKYSSKVVNIEELQSFWNKSQALIEYSLQDSLIYIFLVTKDTFLLTLQEADATFYNNLKFYTEFLLNDYSLPYSGYNTAAYALYKKLIFPVEKYLARKELIIVPDASLSLISFDAFLTRPEKGNPMNMYCDENYLLKKYPIGYAFSATHLVSSAIRKFSFWKNFIGFAPDYTSSPDSLKNIPDAVISLKRIKRLFFGKAIVGSNAMESVFKKKNNYSIINLFVHGIEDTLNPSMSCIYFSPDTDSLEDSYLHAYELSNMRINCNLISIISCYSGSGTLSKGEGVLSIGRSFANAGAPSMILSIWIMSSGTASMIMKDFYWNLLKGYSKAESLQKAKLNYLKKVSPIDADPKVWSGLILIGNNDPLFKGYFIKMIVLPILILGLLILLIIYRKKLP